MDSLEYINAYFGGGFSPEEAGRFEQRIQDDPAFAAEVAYYISARAALKEARSEERIARFGEIYRQRPAPAKISPMGARRWVPALAAAVVLAAVALSWLLFSRQANPPQVADRWIGENLAHLSVKMSGADSMQTGLDLYNSGRFPEALQQFEGILGRDSLNPAALLDAGIVSLRMGNYDQALDFFRKLAFHTDPNLNPALFFEALTLMKRNRDGDTDLAKQVLKRIVQQDLNKKKDAQELLGKL
jgi:tetratricopeptide (TPR) repeat protein